MGNCCTVESSDSEDWAGEDWGSLTSKYNNSKSESKSISSRKVFDNEDQNEKGDPRESDDGLMKLGSAEKERLLGSVRVSSCDANGKVKIMISKKELDKLLKGSSSSNTPQSHDQKQIRGAGPSSNRDSSASAEIVLARLIYAKDHYDHRDVHHRHWKPALHSIPE